MEAWRNSRIAFFRWVGLTSLCPLNIQNSTLLRLQVICGNLHFHINELFVCTRPSRHFCWRWKILALLFFQYIGWVLVFWCWSFSGTIDGSSLRCPLRDYQLRNRPWTPAVVEICSMPSCGWLFPDRQKDYQLPGHRCLCILMRTGWQLQLPCSCPRA